MRIPGRLISVGGRLSLVRGLSLNCPVEQALMTVVNIHQAKTHLSRLLEQVAAGEEVVIAKAGKPIARLVPVAEKLEPRPLGFLKFDVPDAFLDPVPDDELQAWGQ